MSCTHLRRYGQMIPDNRGMPVDLGPRPDFLLSGDPQTAVWWQTLAAGETLRVQMAFPHRRAR